MKKTTRPQHIIDEAVKRYLAGEDVNVLCKYYKVSRAGFYIWVRKYKAHILETDRRATMLPASLEAEDHATIVAQNKILRDENQRLRNKLVAMLLASGELHL